MQDEKKGYVQYTRKLIIFFALSWYMKTVLSSKEKPYKYKFVP